MFWMWSGWRTSTCWLMSSARKWLLSAGLRLTGSGATYSSCTRVRLRGARNSACMAPGPRRGPDRPRGTRSPAPARVACWLLNKRCWLTLALHSFSNSLVGLVLLLDAAVSPDICPIGTSDPFTIVPLSEKLLFTLLKNLNEFEFNFLQKRNFNDYFHIFIFMYFKISCVLNQKRFSEFKMYETC